MNVMQELTNRWDMAPRHKMSKRDFERTVRGLTMAPEVADRCRAVLVDGQRQIDVATDAGVGAGAISSAVARVWRSYLDTLEHPDGFEEVTALLTESQAAVVRTWHRENEDRRIGA